MTEVIITAVEKCARCGGCHTSVEFQPLSNPPAQYSHFAKCPNLFQPILLKVPETE